MAKQLLLCFSTASRPPYLSAVQGSPASGKLCRFPHAFYRQLRSVVSSIRSSSRAVLAPSSIPFRVHKHAWLRPMQMTGAAQNTADVAGLGWPLACPALTQTLHRGEEWKAVDLHETSQLSHKGKPFFLKSTFFFFSFLKGGGVCFQGASAT